jgi:hypothetical protein
MLTDKGLQKKNSGAESKAVHLADGIFWKLEKNVSRGIQFPLLSGIRMKESIQAE